MQTTQKTSDDLFVQIQQLPFHEQLLLVLRLIQALLKQAPASTSPEQREAAWQEFLRVGEEVKRHWPEGVSTADACAGFP